MKWFMKIRDDVKLLTVTLQIIKNPSQPEIRIRDGFGLTLGSAIIKGPFFTAATWEKTDKLKAVQHLCGGRISVRCEVCDSNRLVGLKKDH